VEGRCMKCGTQREMENPKIVQTARGGYMAKGKCIKCGTNMCAILSKDKAEKAISSGEATKSF